MSGPLERNSNGRRRVRIGLACLPLAFALACGGGPGGTLVRTDDGFRLTEAASIQLGASGRFREANAALDAEELETAIAGLESTAAEMPNRAAPRVNLGIALRRANRLEEAAETLREAIVLHPRHVVAHNELGLVHRRLGNFEAARESYERAIDLFDDFHYAHRNLGILCDLFLEDTRCALAHYRRTLEIVPDDRSVAMWITDLEQRAAQTESR